MKQYVTPQCEEVQLEPLMVDYFLGIATVSGGAAAPVYHGQGA